MFNPLVDNFKDLSDFEIESKISELGRKYWQASNPSLKAQIATIMEMYKDEMRARRAKTYQKMNKNDDSDLDNLININ